MPRSPSARLPRTPKRPVDPRPLRDADLSRVQAVFTDVDGTLTTDGLIESRTLASLEALRSAGVRVVLVSGRPSGFGECWARTLSVDGAILENGGLWFVRDANGRVRKTYLQPERTRFDARKRLMRETRAVLRRVPGARLSTDSLFTEVDIAVDYNEEIQLGTEAAGRIEELFRARGVNAVRSSVHVNAWIGRFDKAVAVRRFLKREWKEELETDDDRWVYLGDSFNDAPLFRAFPLSIGVANVRSALPDIASPPRYITRGSEGAGVREVARAILAARKPGKKQELEKKKAALRRQGNSTGDGGEALDAASR